MEGWTMTPRKWGWGTDAIEVRSPAGNRYTVICIAADDKELHWLFRTKEPVDMVIAFEGRGEWDKGRYEAPAKVLLETRGSDASETIGLLYLYENQVGYKIGCMKIISDLADAMPASLTVKNLYDQLLQMENAVYQAKEKLGDLAVS